MSIRCRLRDKLLSKQPQEPSCLTLHRWWPRWDLHPQTGYFEYPRFACYHHSAELVGQERFALSNTTF